MMGSITTKHNPKFGILSIPHLGRELRQTGFMSTEPRHILAKNVRALMQASPRLGTIVRLSEASGVSKGVVERMTKAEANTGVDHLAGIARAFQLPIWALLHENLDPYDGVPESIWPFEDITPQQFASLPERRKGMIEAKAMDIYQEWDASQKDGAT